jgi:hypothetical protein
MIVSGQLRYPIYFRPLFKRKWPSPEAVKVKGKVKGPLFWRKAISFDWHMIDLLIPSTYNPVTICLINAEI